MTASGETLEPRPAPMRVNAAAFIVPAIAVSVAFPWLVGFEHYALFNAAVALVYVLLATGYNVLIGMCGQLALSHVAFFGIGAYASALLTRDHGLDWPLALAVAMALPAAAAWFMAQAATRLVGPYLAMVTFAFHSLMLTLFINWVDLTNGWGGISRIPPASIGPVTFRDPTMVFFLLLAFAWLGLLFAHRLKATRFGRAMLAIRENRLAARGVGIDTARTITFAFCVSGAFAGLAGSLHAHFVRYIDPTSFGLQKLVDLLIIIIIGGRGSVWGVALTAVLFVFAMEYLRFLQEWKLMVFGLLLIVFINVSPNGAGPLLAAAVKRLRRRAP